MAIAPYSAMRSTKRVLIGSLAAARRSASLATLHRHAVDLEHDAAGLDARDPEFRRALALAHAHFDRLLRHRHVREDADPDAARRASCGASCARRAASIWRAVTRSGSSAFRPNWPKSSVGAAPWRRRGCGPCAPCGIWSASVAAWLYALLVTPSRVSASRRGRPASPSASFLSCAIGSCSRISPLKIQTLTPQVP